MESRPAFHFTCVGFSLICLPTQLIAGMVNSPASVDLASSSSEPFGFSTTKVTTGVLLEKWLKIEHEIDAERLVLRNCERNRASCQSRTAIQFLAIIYIGRTLEGSRTARSYQSRNQSKNKANERFSNLRGGGCLEFAFDHTRDRRWRLRRLRDRKVDDLRIVILRDDVREEDHAVVAARLDGSWLMLDNRRMVMAEDRQVPYYHPVFLIYHDEVKRYPNTPSTSVGARGPERAVGRIRR